MKRALHVAAAVALAACASQQRTASSTAAAGAPAAQEPSIEPSSMSPEQVRMVQHSLVDRGFAVDLTGSFDPPTRTALVEFQRARGLPASGNLDTATVEALGLDPRDVMPVRGETAAAPGTSAGSAGEPSGTGAGSAAPVPPDRNGEGPARSGR